MKPNTIEYSPGDRLVYYIPTSDIKIPIAFVPVAGDMVLLINSSSPWRTKQLINDAVSSMKAESIDGAPVIREDAFRLTDLTTKRVCYFAKFNGVYMKVTKVENVGRNANPSNVLGTTNFDLTKVPADIVRALQAIVDNPTMPGIAKFGMYIPLQLYKLLDNKSQCPKYGVPYTFKIVHTRMTKTTGVYALHKEVDGKYMWGKVIAEYDGLNININPVFKDVNNIIRDLISEIKSSGVVIVPVETGEILFRTHEASLIEEPTKYRMAIMTKTEGAVYIGKVLVAQKMAGNEVIGTVPVAMLNKDIVEPLDGFESYKEAIETCIPGPHDHGVRPMYESIGKALFWIKEQGLAKPSEPMADISPKVMDKKNEVKPLIINSNIILI